MIHKIISSVHCTVKLVVKKFWHSTVYTNQSKFNKSPQSFKPTNTKHLFKTLGGDSVINSRLSPPSLQFDTKFLQIKYLLVYMYTPNDCKLVQIIGHKNKQWRHAQMDIHYTWIYWQGKFSWLLIWTSFIGQFIISLGGEDIGEGTPKWI